LNELSKAGNRLSGERLFQAFKYAVYALLTLNIFIFFAEEWAAMSHRFGGGIGFGDLIEGFAATIDTSAWVILLLLFELETYLLDDRHFTPLVTRSLHVLRVVCYAFIVYAFYGYVIKLLYLQGSSPLANVTDLCTLAADRWSYAVDLDEYELITLANCPSLSQASQFLRFDGLQTAVDAAGMRDILRLAWVDVINSAVWLLVVILLEVDVRLQERNALHGLPLKLSRIGKFTLYSLLLMAAIYWGIKGDFVDFWDAFLWLVAFVFIERNVFEWRKESLEEASPA